MAIKKFTTKQHKLMILLTIPEGEQQAFYNRYRELKASKIVKYNFEKHLVKCLHASWRRASTSTPYLGD